MFKSRSAVVLFTSCTLLLGAPALLAEPKDKGGYPQQMPIRHDGKAGQDRPGAAPHRQIPQDDRARMDYRSEPRSQDRDRYRGDRYSGNFRVDHDHIRVVIGGHADYWRPGPALPPGIRQNLRRGKPLPPGIDKHWLDGRLERQLPHYDGHEWVRVGNDLVLISVSTRLINDVLYDIFH